MRRKSIGVAARGVRARPGAVPTRERCQAAAKTAVAPASAPHPPSGVIAERGGGRARHAARPSRRPGERIARGVAGARRPARAPGRSAPCRLVRRRTPEQTAHVLEGCGSPASASTSWPAMTRRPRSPSTSLRRVSATTTPSRPSRPAPNASLFAMRGTWGPRLGRSTLIRLSTRARLRAPAAPCGGHRGSHGRDQVQVRPVHRLQEARRRGASSPPRAGIERLLPEDRLIKLNKRRAQGGRGRRERPEGDAQAAQRPAGDAPAP